MAYYGGVRQGKAGVARMIREWYDAAGSGLAGGERLGLASSGKVGSVTARQRRSGLARHGVVSQGRVWHSKSGGEKSLSLFFLLLTSPFQ